MDAEDFVSPEVGAAVALTALAHNAGVRRVVRAVLVRALALTLGTAEATRRFAASREPLPDLSTAGDKELDAEQHGRRSTKTGAAPS